MRNTPIFPRAILAFLIFSAVAKNAAAQGPVLGVLEEVPDHFATHGSFPAVRIVFRKDTRGWQAFRSNCPDQRCLKTITSEFPTEVNWTISFDGRKVGQLTGRTPSEFKFYSHVGLQEISSGGQVPSVGTKSIEFSGGSDIPVHRPLIASSTPYYQDPDLWKPAQPPAEFVDALRQQFRRKFGRLCRISPRDETKLETLPYRNEDIKIIKGYASKQGWWVARLHLEGAVDCADVEAGFEIDDSWFVASPQGNPEYLDSGMLLVDAGDYDNDGKSEVVFAINEDNRGGYVLYFDDFKKHVTFKFFYH